MNSINTNMTSQAAATAMETIFQDAYQSYIYILVTFGTAALSFYTIVLEIALEIEHIWLKPFRIPSLLYVFAKYGNLISQGLHIGASFVPAGRTCENYGNVTNAIACLTATGVQGLLVARAYSLGSGSRIMIGFLVFSFLSESGLDILITIMARICTATFGTSGTALVLLTDTSVIVTDLLAFCICLRGVLGTWKLKRKSGAQGRNDLVSILLRQTISRFCFVIALTVTSTIFLQADRNSPIIGDNLIAFQNVLSAVLVTGFTLELRQRNSALIEASNISLPTMQFSSILQHIHRTLTVEMGDHDNMNLEGENGVGLTSPDGGELSAQDPLGRETTEARAV